MERFSPALREQHPQLYYEHLHRYLLAKENIQGGVVLDMACGAGYGTRILAEVADEAVGIDLSEDAVGAAQEQYGSRNLRFIASDCCKTELPDNSADHIVSFETIEHLREPVAFLDEIARILKPTGTLFLSSPDKREYTDRVLERNPYHLKELYHEDLAQLLQQRFAHCIFAKQRLVAGSHIAADSSGRNKTTIGTFYGDAEGAKFSLGVPEGKYSIAVCSNEKLRRIKLGLFENKLDSAVAWDAREQIVPLKEELEQTKKQRSRLQAELLSKDKAFAGLRSQIDACTEQLDRVPKLKDLEAVSEKSQSLLEQQLERLDSLARANEALESANGRVETLQLELAASEKRFGENQTILDVLSDTLGDVEEQNQHAQERINQQTKELLQLRESGTSKEKHIDQLVRKVEELDRRLSETIQRLDETTGQRDDIENRYNHIKTTFSWRSTMPLRAVRRFFTRIGAGS